LVDNGVNCALYIMSLGAGAASRFQFDIPGTGALARVRSGHA
jgi:hypothetical protein